MKKWGLASLFAICLVASLLYVMPSSVHAATSGSCGENLTWSLSNGTLTISGSGAMENYIYNTIPWKWDRSSINAVVIQDGVTTIGNNAFNDCDSLTSVTIGDSVSTIGDYAFRSCGSLSSVTIPNSVITIGNYVFYDCDSLTTVPVGKSVTTIGDCAFVSCGSLNSVTIGNSVTTIGKSAFSSCGNLSSVTIGNSVITIGESAFYQCSNLTSVTIGNGVTTIGNSAFYNCDSLISVIVPNGITTIGDKVFYDCDSLISVTISDGVTTIGNDMFCGCDSLTSVTIGDSVRTIGDYAFRFCGSLSSVTIPNSVTTIGDYAFGGCNMPSITLPDSVTTIGDYAFGGCAISSITIPDSVITIGESAFYQCSNLTSVTIGNGVTSIGTLAFQFCDNLTDVFVTDPSAWCKISFGDYYSNPAHFSNNLHFVDTSGNEVANIVLDTTVTKIPGGAFRNCKALTTITVPDSVTAIGHYAFYGCDSLISVTVLDGVTTIGDEVFYDCDSLISVIIPDSVTTIGVDVLSGCSSLENITIPFVGKSRKTASDTYQYPLGYLFGTSSYAGGVSTKQYYFGSSTSSTTYSTYYIPASLKSVTVTGGDILYGAFYLCSNLTSVTIGDSVTTIGRYAFKSCFNLSSVIIPDSVTSIEAYAFDYCNNLTIHGIAGSYAQQYAEANDIPFIVLKNDEACNGETTFATLQEALDAYEGGTIQLQADVDSVTVTKNAVIDLNGFDIASVKMTSATLKVLDSKTDDYTIADGDYGKIAFFIGGTVTPAEGYIAIGELDGFAYHKVSLEITDMTLRSADAGVYYKCTFNGDEMVAEQVTSYGVALSVRGTPTIGTLGTQYSAFTEFTSGANTPSTLLKNVLKETNTTAQNNRNADMKVYGRPYIQIGERYIYGETVSRSFREQVELADTIWSTLTAEQQTAVQEMYRTFQTEMDTWTIPNIKASV